MRQRHRAELRRRGEDAKDNDNEDNYEDNEDKDFNNVNNDNIGNNNEDNYNDGNDNELPTLVKKRRGDKGIVQKRGEERGRCKGLMDLQRGDVLKTQGLDALTPREMSSSDLVNGQWTIL